MKKILLTAALVTTLSGCAWIAQETEYSNLLDQADNEFKLANKTGFMWRDTEKLLTQAKEAKDAGDTEKAIKLAKKAIKEAQLAQAQAQGNAKAGPQF
jgi:hypothetical protein